MEVNGVVMAVMAVMGVAGLFGLVIFDINYLGLARNTT